MKNISTVDLVYLLDRNYPVGATTFGPCSEGCGKPSRGSGFCKQCIIDELRSRGVSGGLINKYCQFQNKRLNAIEKLGELKSEIIKECDK